MYCIRKDLHVTGKYSGGDGRGEWKIERHLKGWKLKVGKIVLEEKNAEKVGKKNRFVRAPRSEKEYYIKRGLFNVHKTLVSFPN